MLISYCGQGLDLNLISSEEGLPIPLAVRVCQVLGEFRDFLGTSFPKQIHQRLLMHQRHSCNRM